MELILDQELKNILYICLNYSKKQTTDNTEADFCFHWLKDTYIAKFGNTFHQSKLRLLARMGYLVPLDTSRKGKRKYYRIADMKLVESVFENK